MQGIVDIGQSLVRTRRRLIDLSWALPSESFVRTLVIEDLDELIEFSLLLKEVCAGRFGGFFLQSEMHALVAAVLLRMAWANAFNADAEAKPPDGKLAQVEQGVSGSEGNAIIAANVGRQTALAEKPLEDGEGVVFART